MPSGNMQDRFAGYLSEKARKIGPAVLAKAADCRADYLAVAAAGARKNRAKWRDLLSRCPDGPVPLLGCGRCTDGKTAALVNGFNAHSLELDDGQRFAMIHLGACVISAIESVRAECGLGEDAVLKGIVMGYEAACRLAIAIQPGHKLKGFHASGTCGTVGAAGGGAVALGMDAGKLKRVIAVAAGSAAGMLEIQEQQSELKPYNLGRAAMDGVAATLMGFTGFVPPDDMLDGDRGFFKIFSDGFDAGKLTGPAEGFEIERIYVKPYASCRHSHSAVEAAIRLHPGIVPGQIESVLVETYRLGVRGHDHSDIRGAASAKLSTPYAVACALLHGRADLSLFEPPDPAALELAPKIRVAENAGFSELCPAKRVAAVTVRLKDGTTLREQVDYAKGEPENPMSPEEIRQKRAMLDAYLQADPPSAPGETE